MGHYLERSILVRVVLNVKYVRINLKINNIVCKKERYFV